MNSSQQLVADQLVRIETTTPRGREVQEEQQQQQQALPPASGSQRVTEARPVVPSGAQSAAPNRRPASNKSNNRTSKSSSGRRSAVGKFFGRQVASLGQIGQSVKSKMNSLCLLSPMRFVQFWPVSTLNRHASSSDAKDNLVKSSPSRMYKLKLLQDEIITPASSTAPTTRSGHRMVADDAGDLYAFGGYNQQVPDDGSSEMPLEVRRKCDTLFQELWKFNWRTRRWKKLRTTGDVPDKLVSHCMCYWRKKIIIYGGTGFPYGRKSSNKLTMYHIEQNRWESVEPLSEPSRSPKEMYGQACICDEDRGELYVVGGTDGSKYNLDVHKFNLYSRKWTPLYKSTGYDPGEPGVRYRHEIALYDNKLFIFGGSTNERFYDFIELPVFDLETNDWTYVKTKPHIKEGRRGSYPKRRKCHSLGVLGRDCYMAGGTDNETICSDIWHINLDEMKWTLLVECIPYPVYFHAASISLAGLLTIFGGVEDIKGKSRNNKLTAIWLKVPSLKHICLSAIGHYAKHKLVDMEKCRATGLDEALEVAST